MEVEDMEEQEILSLWSNGDRATVELEKSAGAAVEPKTKIRIRDVPSETSLPSPITTPEVPELATT